MPDLNEASPEEQDGPDEGPILLPAGASCQGCHYSETIRMAGQIQTVLICRRHPPAPVFMPNPQGGVLTSSPPQVPADYVCFEYDAKEALALIPTGLG